MGEPSMKKRSISANVFFLLLIGLFLHTLAYAESCEKVVHAVNVRLSPGINEPELIEILRNLNRTNNTKLPEKFVNKRDARSLGWKPGKNIWSVSALRGFSIGGDHFRNREGRLPNNKWREADLDYKGGHRGVKRFIFSRDGLRFVTVDHYRTFTEVPACR
jgi:ribonuclease T1